MKRKAILSIILILHFAIFNTLLFAQLYHVTLDQRIENSKIIFEGKVISKKSFWDVDNYNIYTSNIIEVYKVFKGNLKFSHVEVITEGGIVGTEMQTVSHSLQLNEDDVGIFNCISNTINKSNKSINPGYISLKTYADLQGFIRYDLNNMSGNDIFNKYADINNDVYTAITSRTKNDYRTIKDVNLYQRKDKK
ncbi:MAG: hypothetical protein FVQ77_11555 [Cytophagales bacterium]|nr:hypothetical protein [Cytophagales bacterium]